MVEGLHRLRDTMISRLLIDLSTPILQASLFLINYADSDRGDIVFPLLLHLF